MTPLIIPVQQVARTPLAILVSNGQREVWVPLSQIIEEITEPAGPMGLPTTTAIVVPDWVASEKGLQPASQDAHTPDLFGDPTP